MACNYFVQIPLVDLSVSFYSFPGTLCSLALIKIFIEKFGFVGCTMKGLDEKREGN